MMTPAKLADIIGPHYADQLDNPAAIATDLAAAGAPLIDNSRKGLLEVKEATSADEVDQLLSAMKAAGALKPLVEGAYYQFLTKGLDFSDPDVRETIDAMAAGAFGPSGSVSAELATVLKSLGIQARTRWEQLGGNGELPTAAEIAVAANLHWMREWFEGKTQDVRAGIEAGTITDVNGVIAEIQS